MLLLGLPGKAGFGCGPIVVNRLYSNTLTGLGLSMSALSMPAHAQSSPKTVTLVVPFAADGGTDTVARLMIRIGPRWAFP
jgi:hypothetical protein